MQFRKTKFFVSLSINNEQYDVKNIYFRTKTINYDAKPANILL